MSTSQHSEAFREQDQKGKRNEAHTRAAAATQGSDGDRTPLHKDVNRTQRACLWLKVLGSLEEKPINDEVLLRPTKCPAPGEGA